MRYGNLLSSGIIANMIAWRTVQKRLPYSFYFFFKEILKILLNYNIKRKSKPSPSEIFLDYAMDQRLVFKYLKLYSPTWPKLSKTENQKLFRIESFMK